MAEVARAFGVSWDTAVAAVRQHGQPLVDDPARIRDVDDLGIDEMSWLAPRRATPGHRPGGHPPRMPGGRDRGP